MISVEQALAAVLALPPSSVSCEEVPLNKAAGRVLAKDAIATRPQPPFDAAAMDGYAIACADPAPGARFTVIGQAAAGHGFERLVQGTEAVRIFTGAPVPAGTKKVVIQEDTERSGDVITLREQIDPAPYIRPAGADFQPGTRLNAPRRLGPSDIALLASMNIAQLRVARKPRVALITTGDELVMPGESPTPDQVIASNAFGLAALAERAGASPYMLPIAKDTAASLGFVLELAADYDLIVTIGGASVGDHDLVAQVATDRGLKQSFYKVAMRPGKPLMAGRIAASTLVGLPGNPVSSMVCGEVFIAPLLDKMQGLPAGARARVQVPLAHDLPANGPREHYMRAKFCLATNKVQVFERQDSALLGLLAQANALVVREPHAPTLPENALVDMIHI